MKRLSYWAKGHPATARLLIIISRCLLLWIAAFLGKELIKTGNGLSPLWIYFFMLLFFLTCLIYPSKRSVSNYARRKWCDLIVCLSGFFMAICLFAQLDSPFYLAAHATMPIETPSYKYPEAQKLLEEFKSGEKTTFTRKEKRIIRREFNYQLPRYIKAKLTGNKEAATDAGTIVLASLAAVGLLFLVASLACTLSCNGSDAAAIVVALLGTVAIIWGFIAIVNSGKRKKKAQAQESQ